MGVLVCLNVMYVAIRPIVQLFSSADPPSRSNIGGKVEAESWVEITIGAAEDACQDKASPEQVIAQLHEVNFDVVSHW